MTPYEHILDNHYKGDTFDGIELSFFNELTQNPIDLTGVDIQMHFRRAKPNGVLVKSLIIGDGITVTDAVNGIFQVDKFLLDWKPELYFYDIQMKFVDDTVKTYIRGTINIIQDTTYTEN